MEKPTVTLRHTEAYLLGGFMLLITVAGYVLSRVVPADQSSQKLSTVIAILLTAFWEPAFTGADLLKHWMKTAFT